MFTKLRSHNKKLNKSKTMTEISTEYLLYAVKLYFVLFNKLIENKYVV